MKRLITSILFLFIVISSYGQENLKITWVNDTVFNYDKALFICKGQTKGAKSLYVIKNMDKKSIAVIMFEELDTVLRTSVNFVTMGLKFNVLYPKIEPIVLLESFVKNKIIIDGSIDTIAVKSYCKEREIPLLNTVTKSAKRPGGFDSLMRASAAATIANSVEFTIVNSTNNLISVKIGKPSNNRTQLLSAGENFKTRGEAGETICILDKNLQSLGCRTIQKTDTKFVIDKSGKRFE